MLIIRKNKFIKSRDITFALNVMFLVSLLYQNMLKIDVHYKVKEKRMAVQ